jgi:hypothetical protein
MLKELVVTYFRIGKCLSSLHSHLKNKATNPLLEKAYGG